MTSPLAQSLAALGLHRTAADLDDLVARATKEQTPPLRLLERIVQIELEDRATRSLERRTHRSRLGRLKHMADFDWTWPKHIDKPLVEKLLRLEFLKDARNIVLVAPQGLGKTMIAQNIAHEALRAGHSVIFTTAAQLLLDLGSRDSSRALDARLKHYARVGLLVIDELGYLSYDARAADLLFQLVSLRYEKKSLVLTTNQIFSQWPTIFPNAACATALIDRVVHHSDIVVIEGDSYRRREAEAALSAKRAPPPAGSKTRGS